MKNQKSSMAVPSPKLTKALALNSAWVLTAQGTVAVHLPSVSFLQRSFWQVRRPCPSGAVPGSEMSRVLGLVIKVAPERSPPVSSCVETNFHIITFCYL